MPHENTAILKKLVVEVDCPEILAEATFPCVVVSIKGSHLDIVVGARFSELIVGHKSSSARLPIINVPRVETGKAYIYQGTQKKAKGKKVRVISQSWPGAQLETDQHLVHVQLIGAKGQGLELTFGCDPRWLAMTGKSVFAKWHDELAKDNKNIQPMKEVKYLADPEDDQSGVASLF